jgi:hypothetical protein
MIIAVMTAVGCSEDEVPVDRFSGEWYYESFKNPNFFKFEIRKVNDDYVAQGKSQEDFTIQLTGRTQSGFESIIIQNGTERHEMTNLTFSEDLNRLQIGSLTVTSPRTAQQPTTFTGEILKKISNRN